MCVQAHIYDAYGSALLTEGVCSVDEFSGPPSISACVHTHKHIQIHYIAKHPVNCQENPIVTPSLPTHTTHYMYLVR